MKDDTYGKMLTLFCLIVDSRFDVVEAVGGESRTRIIALNHQRKFSFMVPAPDEIIGMIRTGISSFWSMYWWILIVPTKYGISFMKSNGKPGKS